MNDGAVLTLSASPFLFYPCPSRCPHPCQVCDSSCGTNRYGDYNCDWKGLGPKCRQCFDDDDIEAALVADDVAKRHGGRVVMCST